LETERAMPMRTVSSAAAAPASAAMTTAAAKIERNTVIGPNLPVLPAPSRRRPRKPDERTRYLASPVMK
jgi:hypothetical protein